jgi:hypothetical protein
MEILVQLIVFIIKALSGVGGSKPVTPTAFPRPASAPPPLPTQDGSANAPTTDSSGRPLTPEERRRQLNRRRMLAAQRGATAPAGSARPAGSSPVRQTPAAMSRRATPTSGAQLPAYRKQPGAAQRKAAPKWAGTLKPAQAVSSAVAASKTGAAVAQSMQGRASGQPAAPAARKGPAFADAPTIRKWLKPQTLRAQFVLTEIFQPPLALRDNERRISGEI